MEQANKAMTKALAAYASAAVKGAVLKLSGKYNFVEEEALAYLESIRVTEEVKKKEVVVRGRPEKAVKAVVNKDLLVEDVIARLFTGAGLGEEASAAVVAEASAAVAVEAPKKKITKKKVEVAPVAPVAEAVVVAEAVPAVEAEAPKKKTTKKKADAEGEAPKKKAAPNKKPVEAEAVVVAEAAPVVVAPVVVVAEAPKKKTEKKKADAEGEAPTKKAAPNKKPVVAEAAPVVVAPVVVAKVAAPEKSVGGFKFKPVEVKPVEVAEAELEAEEEAEDEEAKEEEGSDEEGSVDVIDFVFEGVEYSRDDNNIVYDSDSEPIGKWTGEKIELFPEGEEEEEED